MSLTHIETVELTGSASSITFSSIPQDYDDLILKESARSNSTSAVYSSTAFRFNNDSGTKYSEIRLLGLEGGVNTSSRTNASELVWLYTSADGDVANVFGNSSTYISNYTSTTTKSISIDMAPESGTSQFLLGIVAATFAGGAITSIQIAPGGGSAYLSGSTFSLYGVTAGGDGTVTTA